MCLIQLCGFAKKNDKVEKIFKKEETSNHYLNGIQEGLIEEEEKNENKKEN